MQCVPCPWPSWTSSPWTNELDTTVRPAKSGCFRSNPVSSTATLMPSPVAVLFGAPVACSPHVNRVSSTVCGLGAAGAVGSIARTNRSGSISAMGPGSSAARASAVTWSSSAVTSATPSSLHHQAVRLPQRRRRAGLGRVHRADARDAVQLLGRVGPVVFQQDEVPARRPVCSRCHGRHLLSYRVGFARRVSANY